MLMACTYISVNDTFVQGFQLNLPFEVVFDQFLEIKLI